MNECVSDKFGRQFAYLRLSVTDICNFRCTYCLPNGYKKPSVSNTDLTPSEIENLVTALAGMGFWKIRLTGGEPTVRKDIVEIAARISAISGIRKVALSTNGYRLKQIAPALKEAGVSAINVSIDSLNPERFEQLTGQALLSEIIEGIEHALALGFESIKVNAVLLKDLAWNEIAQFIDWVRDKPIAVRFIELMQTSSNLEFFNQHHISADFLVAELNRRGWHEKLREAGAGPAREFVHTDYSGRLGVIAPYSKDFCKSCNRLRVSAQGELRLCLFAEGNFSLRHLLQSPDDKRELQNLVQSIVQEKQESHYLQMGRVGNMRSFSIIGG